MSSHDPPWLAALLLAILTLSLAFGCELAAIRARHDRLAQETLALQHAVEDLMREHRVWRWGVP